MRANRLPSWPYGLETNYRLENIQNAGHTCAQSEYFREHLVQNSSEVKFLLSVTSSSRATQSHPLPQKAKQAPFFFFKWLNFIASQNSAFTCQDTMNFLSLLKHLLLGTWRLVCLPWFCHLPFFHFMETNSILLTGLKCHPFLSPNLPKIHLSCTNSILCSELPSPVTSLLTFLTMSVVHIKPS